MRDFYDIHILHQIYGSTLSASTLRDALIATSNKRGTRERLKDAEVIFDEVEKNSIMEKLWKEYQKKFSYAADIGWHTVMSSVRDLFLLGGGV